MLPASAIVETIQVMLRQEVAYATTFDTATPNHEETPRTKMVDWCCRVVSYCHLDIEIAAIAMNYADRMCMIRQPYLLQSNLYEYQLIVMTSLYIAAKVHAPEALDPKLVSNLSRQLYTPQQIEECERTILSTLSYRVNPITAYAYLHPMLELLVRSWNDECTTMISIHERDIAMKFACQQIDTYICHNHCSSSIRHSMVAYCAFMNALGYISLRREGKANHTGSTIILYNYGCNLARLFHVDLMDEDDIRTLTQTQQMLSGGDGGTTMASPGSTMSPRHTKCTLPTSPTLYKQLRDKTIDSSIATTNATTIYTNTNQNNKRIRVNDCRSII